MRKRVRPHTRFLFVVKDVTEEDARDWMRWWQRICCGDSLNGAAKRKRRADVMSRSVCLKYQFSN